MSTTSTDHALWKLCQRDQQLALLADARRADAEGDPEAKFVIAWMSQLLEVPEQRLEQ